MIRGAILPSLLHQDPRHFSHKATKERSSLYATSEDFRTLFKDDAQGLSKRIHAEGSLQTTLTDERNENNLASPARVETPRISAEDDLNDPQHFTDDELVVAAQNGFSSALGVLLTRHRSILHRTVRRMTTTAEEAEDVVQDAMLRACVSIGSFRREARFSTWLIAIATNSLLSSRRKLRPTHWIYLDDAEASTQQRVSYELRDPRPTPERECMDRNLLECVQRELQTLHPSHRSVLQTRTIDRDLLGESARDLGITVATFKSRLSRARSQLSRAVGRTQVNKSTSRKATRRRHDGLARAASD
jgi:RNA polymerase sigma-70 factor, ECF subfamily